MRCCGVLSVTFNRHTKKRATNICLLVFVLQIYDDGWILNNVFFLFFPALFQKIPMQLKSERIINQYFIFSGDHWLWIQLTSIDIRIFLSSTVWNLEFAFRVELSKMQKKNTHQVQSQRFQGLEVVADLRVNRHQNCLPFP